MGRLVSPANIHTSSRCRPSRISWGCLSLQPIRTNKRSHVPAAAPSDSEADAFADKAAENLAIQFPEPDSSQYSIVEGESGEQEHGVRRNEDGDIEFAQRDSMGELTFEKVDKYTGLAIEAYDPMVNGKWVEIDGVDVKMPDYDFSQHDWMLRVETDIGWPMFWRHFEDLTSTDDEYIDGEETLTDSGRLALHSESKRHEALEAQEILAGTPMMAAPALEVDEPNQIEEPTIQDRERRDAIDEWELRAIREKQLARDQWDLYWQFQQWDRMDMLNHPPNEQRDVRYIAKLRAERFDWTEDEIKDVITSEGRAVDPKIVLNAPTFKTQNPYHMPDYASQGIPYLQDMEDWIESEGRWMDQHNLSEVGDDEDSDEDYLSAEALAQAPDEDALDPMIEGIESGEITLTDEGEIVRGGRQ